MEINRKDMRVITENGNTQIFLYAMKIMVFNTSMIKLDFCGMEKMITRKRMNQVSEAFNLGFRIYQKQYRQYVDYAGVTHVFGFNSAGKLALSVI